MSRDTGIPASKRFRIENEIVALDLDLTISLRLLRFDNERNVQQAKRIAYEVSKMFGTSEESDDSILESDEIIEYLKNDKYADKNTRFS